MIWWRTNEVYLLYVVVDDVAFDAVADSDIVYYNDPAAAKKKEMYI